MRHVRRYRKLGREGSHRRSMLRNLATSFFTHGRIVTTLHRAKAAQPIVEKLITQSLKAHSGHLGARRKVMNYLHNTKTPLKFFQDLSTFDPQRHTGGLTRVVRLGELRKGDGAVMAVLMATEAITDPASWQEQQERRQENRAQRERQKTKAVERVDAPHKELVPKSPAEEPSATGSFSSTASSSKEDEEPSATEPSATEPSATEPSATDTSADSGILADSNTSAHSEEHTHAENLASPPPSEEVVADAKAQSSEADQSLSHSSAEQHNEDSEKPPVDSSESKNQDA